MLTTHLNNSETLLLCQRQIPAIGGHSLHLGTPREVFVREFLESHLPSDVAIGSGEIIDCSSAPGVSRHQHDIVLYRRNYPRIYLGGGITAFLNESVVATIEVKSTLDQDGVDQVVGAGLATKSLVRSTTGLARPIANFIVAYAGPAQMSTVFNWIRNAYSARQLSDPLFATQAMPRRMIDSAALNGVFVLGKGACLFENDIGYLHDGLYYNADPNLAWSISDCERGSLALFFAVLLGLASSSQSPELNPWPYFGSHTLPPVTFERIDAQEPDSDSATTPDDNSEATN